LARVFIVYDTQYGNTKLVAEKISEGIREFKVIETEVCNVKEVDFKKLADADAILIGAPNHMGSPSRTIMKFIDELNKLELKAKRVAVFDTHLMKDEKAIGKMEKREKDKTLPHPHTQKLYQTSCADVVTCTGQYAEKYQ
jgi:flavodoxin